MKSRIDSVTVYSDMTGRDPVIVIRYRSGAALIVNGCQRLPKTVFKFTQEARISVTSTDAGSEIVFR